MSGVEEATLEFVDYFVPEFITQMRQTSQIIDKPSSRQSIRMYKMLLPRFIKKGKLGFEDLVEIAVITTRPDDQETATKLAWQIIFGTEEGSDRGIDFLLGDSGDLLKDFLDAKQQSDLTQMLIEEPKDALEDIMYMYLTKEDLEKLGALLELLEIKTEGVGEGEDQLIKAMLGFLKWETRKPQREFMKETLKRKLIKLGWSFERMSKIQLSRHLRPFEPGEDTELIDTEKSMEHILIDKGKTLDQIESRDFLMRKLEKKKRTIIYLYDVSNTMQDDVLGGGSSVNSLQYSALCLIPLIWIFRKEKYGLGLFESNTHIVKDLLENLNEHKVIDVVLDSCISNAIELQKRFVASRLQTASKVTSEWGGTVPNSGLDWASDQLRHVRDRSFRLCFLFTDAIFEDPDAEPEEAAVRAESYKIMREMIDSGIKVIVCLSPVAEEERHKKYTDPTIEKMKEVGCEFISTKDPKTFLEEVSFLLQNFER